MTKVWHRIFRPRNQEDLWRAFLGGSLLVLFICLAASAVIFSYAFVTKEEQRAKISREQLITAFDFEYRLLSEEMFGHNAKSVAKRVDEIAKQIGDPDYKLVLSDEKGQCLLEQDNRGSRDTCMVPEDLGRLMASNPSIAPAKPEVKFNEASNSYIYMVPLGVGPTVKGYLYASFTDRYDFYRGGVFAALMTTLLPSLAFIFVLWFLWLFACRRLFLKPYLASLEEMKNNEAIARMASHTAHDMRDPLSWINKLVASLKDIPEETRIMMHSAVYQLQDIANGLLSQSRALTMKADGDSDPTRTTRGDVRSIELLSSLISRIVSEKRIQYKSRSQIKIETRLGQESYGLFARVQSSELWRIISNLVNNAVEAIEKEGHVLVTLSKEDNEVILAVLDNGKGIPKEILPELGRLGATFGKSRGNGLALYHAKATIESWGGKFQITSEVGKGTKVAIILPQAPTPNWFVPQINLSRDGCVVVIDDHPSTHDIWETRLSPVKSQCNLEIVHCASENELTDWYLKHRRTGPVLYLCDQELLNGSQTGLEIIEELGIQDQAILVTSHAEDEDVRLACVRSGIKLLPKESTLCVPFAIDAFIA
jgi:signal transduction histidine kinase